MREWPNLYCMPHYVNIPLHHHDIARVMHSLCFLHVRHLLSVVVAFSEAKCVTEPRAGMPIEKVVLYILGEKGSEIRLAFQVYHLKPLLSFDFQCIFVRLE